MLVGAHAPSDAVHNDTDLTNFHEVISNRCADGNDLRSGGLPLPLVQMRRQVRASISFRNPYAGLKAAFVEAFLGLHIIPACNAA